MKFFTITSSLIVAVSAIDLRLRTGKDCQNTYVRCKGINPNVCCYSPSGAGFPAVGAVHIPSNWRIEVRAYQGGNCKTLRKVDQSGGRTNLCLSEADNLGRLTGVGWNFAAKKRDGAAQGCPATGCTSSVPADALVLEDEITAYSIEDMDKSLLDAL